MQVPLSAACARQGHTQPDQVSFRERGGGPGDREIIPLIKSLFITAFQCLRPIPLHFEKMCSSGSGKGCYFCPCCQSVACSYAKGTLKELQLLCKSGMDSNLNPES